MSDILFTKRLFGAAASGGSTSDGANKSLSNLNSTGEAHFIKPTDYASASAYGVVKVDGTTITATNGVITAQGVAGAKLYTLDGLSITSTNVDIRTLVQAVDAKNLPIGSIVTGSVLLTDAPATNLTDAMVEIVSYQLDEGGSTNTIYDITLNSREESPYQWHAEYWTSHPTASVSWSSAPLALYNMPTASATYLNKVAQYVGPGDGVHEQGLYYICEEQAGSYSWNHLQVEQIASTSDFGIVKIKTNSGGSEPLQITDGVLSANKATGNYSLSVAGNGSTTNSSTNMGSNSTAHGWYAMALGCDAVVGDSTNDVRVPGAIQLGRGTNTTAGSMYVGLSNNGTTWNNYQLLDSAGMIPSARIDFPVDDVQVNGTSILSSGVANVPYAGTTNAGVIKTNTSYGTSTNSDGVLQAETKTNAEYNNLANTIFIGKGTLENVLTGKGIQRTTVADTTSTSASISVQAGYDYTFSNALTSLTITANDTSFNESTITFTSGSTITVSLPASLSQLGSIITFEPNTTYVLSIWNNKLLVGVQS